MSDRVVVHLITLARFREALVDLERVKLIAERKRRRWTQATLAEVTGYALQTVKFWEQGRKTPRPASLADWREALR